MIMKIGRWTIPPRLTRAIIIGDHGYNAALAVLLVVAILLRAF